MNAETTESAAHQTLAFRISALNDRVRELGEKVTHAITRVIDIAQSMSETAMRAVGRVHNERGPADYDIRRDERRVLTSVLQDLLKEIRRRPPPSMNNGDDSAGVKKWVAGVGAVLATAFIIAGWTISNQVAAQSVQIENLINQVREQNARITRIEQQSAERR